MKYLILAALAAIALSGCGRVDVYHHVETDGMLDIFEATCKAQHPTYSFSQTQACAQAALGEFLNTLSKGN